MPFTKDKKKQMLTELETKLASAKSVVFAQYAGTKVSKIQELRRSLRDSNAVLRVTKNSLLRKALDKNNLKVDEIVLNSQIAAAFDDKDEVNPVKILTDKAKEVETIKILGALVNGEFYTPEQVAQLAKLPSREQLYAQVVYTIKSPLTGMVNVLAGNIRGLVNVLNARKEKIA